MKTFVQITIILLVILFGVLAYFSDNQVNPSCRGRAKCFTGQMERIIDGDTYVINKQDVRVALANTPEKGEKGYNEAITFVEKICPVGSKVVVDQDDRQLHSYNRMIADVHCNGFDLSEELLKNNLAVLEKDFCSRSEFGNEIWSKNYGC
jgi:endonuclease YncB( thermonuclease family)